MNTDSSIKNLFREQSLEYSTSGEVAYFNAHNYVSQPTSDFMVHEETCVPSIEERGDLALHSQSDEMLLDDLDELQNLKVLDEMKIECL